MKFGIFVYDRFWPLLGVKWSKRPVEKLLPSVRNIKVPDNCQNIKSLLGKFNILWPNATKQYFVGQKDYTLCKITFWEAVTQPFGFSLAEVFIVTQERLFSTKTWMHQMMQMLSRLYRLPLKYLAMSESYALDRNVKDVQRGHFSVLYKRTEAEMAWQSIGLFFTHNSTQE